MLTIRQFRYNRDNLTYLISGPGTALAIDGGAAREIIDLTKRLGVELRYIANTHGHPDHLTGNTRLLRESGAELLDSMTLAKRNSKIVLDGNEIGALHTPGHSQDSVVFVLDGALITGDTLFNGTVGNCFTGDLEAFYYSIKKILEFPPSTQIYAGHDYVADSVAFARTVEPGNQALDKFEAAYNPALVCSTIADELLVNPYLRFNTPSIIALLQQRGKNTSTELDRWKSVMTL